MGCKSNVFSKMRDANFLSLMKPMKAIFKDVERDPEDVQYAML